jgi:hypothetical protein
MNDWPAMMKTDTAARYCDLSRSAFLGEVARGRLPHPVPFGGRDHWHRPALDAALANIAGQVDTPAYRRALQDRYGTAAAS